MTERSTLVTQTLLDEYLELVANEVKWGRMWSYLFRKEQLLSNWAREKHLTAAGEFGELSGLNEEEVDYVANMMDSAFLTGLFFGARRLETQRGESDWIQEAYEAPSKEPER